jgi:hypothetical protein
MVEQTIEPLSIGQRFGRIFRPGRPRRRVISARVESAPEIYVRVATGDVSFHRVPRGGSETVRIIATIRSHDPEIAASTSLHVQRTDSLVRIESAGDHIGDPVTTVSTDIDVWVPDGVRCRATVGIGSIEARDVMTSGDQLRTHLGRIRMHRAGRASQ